MGLGELLRRVADDAKLAFDPRNAFASAQYAFDDPVGFGKAFAKGYAELVQHPIRSFETHPLLSALQVAPAAGGAVGAGGKLAEMFARRGTALEAAPQLNFPSIAEASAQLPVSGSATPGRFSVFSEDGTDWMASLPMERFDELLHDARRGPSQNKMFDLEEQFTPLYQDTDYGFNTMGTLDGDGYEAPFPLDHPNTKEMLDQLVAGAEGVDRSSLDGLLQEQAERRLVGDEDLVEGEFPLNDEALTDQDINLIADAMRGPSHGDSDWHDFLASRSGEELPLEGDYPPLNNPRFDPDPAINDELADLMANGHIGSYERPPSDFDIADLLEGVDSPPRGPGFRFMGYAPGAHNRSSYLPETPRPFAHGFETPLDQLRAILARLQSQQ